MSDAQHDTHLIIWAVCRIRDIREGLQRHYGEQWAQFPVDIRHALLWRKAFPEGLDFSRRERRELAAAVDSVMTESTAK